MTKIGLFIGLVCMAFATNAQKIKPTDYKLLAKYNDSLGYWSNRMVDDSMPGDRFRSDDSYTRMLVKALKTPYSFYYTFDSVQTVTTLFAPDSTFKIFTWQIIKDESLIHQKGAIQINTPDGSLKLFPLYDVSDFTDLPEDSIRDNKNWIGNIYYKILANKTADKMVYTLLGYDEYDINSTKKWIDFLTFNDEGSPQFGGNFINIKYDSLYNKTQKRFYVQFKKKGRARLNYDEEEKMIIFDNLISENDNPTDKTTLVPSGEYEAFKWENDKWNHIPKISGQDLKDGNEPTPELIMDKEGNIIDDGKLDKISEANYKKEQKNNPEVKTETKPIAKPVSKKLKAKKG